MDSFRPLKRPIHTQVPLSVQDFAFAVNVGDIPTMAAYLAQDDVQREVERAEATISAPLRSGLRTLFRPWLRPFTSQYPRETIFESAAQNGHAHVVEWLFAAERATTMGQTRASFFAQTLQQAASGECMDVIEILLNSYVFLTIVKIDNRQLILDSAVKSCRSADALQILVSHGAKARSADVHMLEGARAVERYLNAGGLDVGDEVEVLPSSTENVRSILSHGAVFSPLALPTTTCQAEFDRAIILLRDAGVDVDTRYGVEEMTALISLSDLPRGSSTIDNQLRTIRLLLEYGADASATNRQGDSAIDTAIERLNVDAFRVLLDHRVANRQGTAIHDDDRLLTHAYEKWVVSSDPKTTLMLSLLLKAGVCPFTRIYAGVTFRDRMMGNPRAKQFFAGHEQLLRTCRQCEHMQEGAHDQARHDLKVDLNVNIDQNLQS